MTASTVAATKAGSPMRLAELAWAVYPKLVTKEGDMAWESSMFFAYRAIVLADLWAAVSAHKHKIDQTPAGAAADRRHIQHLEHVLSRLEEYGLSARGKEAVHRKRSKRDRRQRQYAQHQTNVDMAMAMSEADRGWRRDEGVPCDIHVMVEVLPTDEGASWLALSAGRNYVPPDYTLFAYLAGVRAYDNIQPIAKPRGIPDDLSADTQREWDDWKDYATVPTWLTPKEWVAACVQTRIKVGKSQEVALCLGNYARALLDTEQIKDVRLVMWFDG